MICDPCLGGQGGHPWAFATALAAAARRIGRDCEIVARTSFRATVPADVAVRPLFRAAGASRLTATAELDRVEGRSRGGPRPFWDPWLRAAARHRRVAGFAADVAPVLRGLRAGDCVLVATASEIDAAGLARAVAAVHAPPGIAWHLLFHAPILAAEAAPEDADGPRVARVRRMLTAAARRIRPHVLRFHATTAELAAEWRWAGADGIDVLPCPVLLPPEGPPARTADGPARVAMLGDMRPEKNSRIVAALAAALAADESLARRVRVVLQTNPGFDPRSRHPADAEVVAALRAVEARADGIVERLGGPLSPGDYFREMSRADAVLLPYDPARYRHRCSTILVEALAHGAVPIVSAGGWMARRFAAAFRDHGRDLCTRFPPLGEESLAGSLAAGETLRFPFRAPDAADAAVVEVEWRGEGSAAAALGPGGFPFDTPLRMSCDDGATPAETVLAADEGGAPVTAVLRLTRRMAAGGVAFRAAGRTAPLHVRARVRWLRCGAPPPLGAAGVVMPSPGDAAAAIREFVDHRRHYLATAATCGWVATHAPDAVLESLLA